MRVIVCGGRTFGEMPTDYAPEDRKALLARANRERGFVFDTLDGYGVTEVAEGGAQGADRHASDWAEMEGKDSERYPAQWAKHGKAAGPIRNQQMLDEFKPDAVIAFPGGRGTADMVRRAKAAGVRVIEVTP